VFESDYDLNILGMNYLVKNNVGADFLFGKGGVKLSFNKKDVN